MMLEYFLTFGFLSAVIKGAMKGWKSELYSLIFAILALLCFFLIYKNNLNTAVIGFTLSSFIYLKGLFLSFKYKKFNLSNIILGSVLGSLKFILFLGLFTIFAKKVSIANEDFLNNRFVVLSRPFSEYIEKNISL